MLKPRVVFLFRKGLVSAGSKIMRCDQLRDISERYLGDRYSFEVVPQRPLRRAGVLRESCETLRGAIVIMLKGTAKLLGDEALTELRKHTRAICVDYVDTNMELKYSGLIDVHISPSIAGMKILRRLIAEKGSAVPDAITAHLTHHADPRLEGFEPLQSNRLCPVYLGNLKNTFLPAAAAAKVDVLEYPSDREIGSVFERLKTYNLHYAVRPPEQSSTRNLATTKPFTKGFVAAAAGANVIASVESDDAIHYLGSDYPFLIEKADETAILAALEKASGLFGTADWEHALDRMTYVRHVTSPAAVAHELDIILSRFA